MSSPTSFQAIRIFEEDGKFVQRIVKRSTEDLPAGEVLIQVHYSWRKVAAEHDATAQRYWVPGGYFGIIPNESEPFCSTCSRLRLTSGGELVGCLSNPIPTSIHHLLNQQEVASELNERVAHSIAFKEPIAFTGSNLGMSRIGG